MHEHNKLNTSKIICDGDSMSQQGTEMVKRLKVNKK